MASIFKRVATLERIILDDLRRRRDTADLAYMNLLDQSEVKDLTRAETLKLHRLRSEQDRIQEAIRDLP